MSVKIPEVVFLNITNKCNLRCKHCYLNSGEDTKVEMNTSEILTVLKKLKEFGIKKIKINGGEPFLKDNLFVIIDESHNMGLKINITTNGMLLTPRLIEELKNANISELGFSLDGSSSKTHELLRGSSNLFSHCIRAIKYAVSIDLPITIFCSIHKKNLNEVEDLIALSNKLSAKRVAFLFFSPFGRGKVNWDDFSIGFKEWSNFWNKIKIKLKNLKTELDIFYEPVFFYGNIRNICSLYTGNICAIDPHGYVYFCPLLIEDDKKYSIGNLIEEPLRDILQNSKRKKILEEVKGHHYCTALALKYKDPSNYFQDVYPKCFMWWEKIGSYEP